MNAVRMQANMLGQLKQQSNGRLRHGTRAISGHIGYDNSSFPRRYKVHNVSAGCKNPDVFQLREISNVLASDRGFVGQENVSFGSAMKQLIRWCSIVNLAGTE